MFLGFLLGFIFCFICFLTAYAILRLTLFKWGGKIAYSAEKELGKLQDKLNPGSEIVFPNLVKEAFDNNATLEEIIKIK